MYVTEWRFGTLWLIEGDIVSRTWPVPLGLIVFFSYIILQLRPFKTDLFIVDHRSNINEEKVVLRFYDSFFDYFFNVFFKRWSCSVIMFTYNICKQDQKGQHEKRSSCLAIFFIHVLNIIRGRPLINAKLERVDHKKRNTIQYVIFL